MYIPGGEVCTCTYLVEKFARVHTWWRSLHVHIPGGEVCTCTYLVEKFARVHT